MVGTDIEEGFILLCSLAARYGGLCYGFLCFPNGTIECRTSRHEVLDCMDIESSMTGPWTMQGRARSTSNRSPRYNGAVEQIEVHS